MLRHLRQFAIRTLNAGEGLAFFFGSLQPVCGDIHHIAGLVTEVHKLLLLAGKGRPLGQSLSLGNAGLYKTHIVIDHILTDPVVCLCEGTPAIIQCTKGVFFTSQA